MSRDDEIVDRLDRIAALLTLAFQEPIDAARARLRADPVVAGVLDALGDDPVPAGTLKASVAKQTGAAGRTIERRIADLVELGAITSKGSTHTRTYRSTRLI